MNNDNGFDLIIAVVFSMSTQLGGIGPKSQDLVISIRLGELENLPQFYLRSLQVRSEIFLLQEKNGTNQQPYRKIHHGTVKIETSAKINDSL